MKRPLLGATWPPAPASSPGSVRRPGRREGMAAGFAIASGIVVLGASIMAINGSNLDTAIAVLAGPTVLAGTVAGWRVGPRAWRARTRDDQFLTCLAVAFNATAIGDLAVGFAIGLTSWSSGPYGLIGMIAQAILSALMMWPFGMLFFGLVALPITFVAGLVWMVAMVRLDRQSATT